MQFAIENNRAFKFRFALNNVTTARFGYIQVGADPIYIERLFYDVGNIAGNTNFYMSMELFECQFSSSPTDQAFSLSRGEADDPRARFNLTGTSPNLGNLLFSTFMSVTDGGNWNLDINVPPLILKENTQYCWRFTPQGTFRGDFGFYYYYRE